MQRFWVNTTSVPYRYTPEYGIYTSKYTLYILYTLEYTFVVSEYIFFSCIITYQEYTLNTNHRVLVKECTRIYQEHTLKIENTLNICILVYS